MRTVKGGVETSRTYALLFALPESTIRKRFMHRRHGAMWPNVDAPDEVIPALPTAPAWNADAPRYASV